MAKPSSGLCAAPIDLILPRAGEVWATAMRAPSLAPSCQSCGRRISNRAPPRQNHTCSRSQRSVQEQPGYDFFSVPGTAHENPRDNELCPQVFHVLHAKSKSHLRRFLDFVVETKMLGTKAGDHAADVDQV